MENEQEIDVLVCARIEGFGRPIYGSLRANCPDCRQAVWVSGAGQKAMRENKNLKPFCMECAFVRMEASGDEEINVSAVPGAIEELKGYFGKIENN